MRKIERDMIRAIQQCINWRNGNTSVVMGHAGAFVVSLHGNVIASNSATEGFRFTLAGWPTPTTRSRVNALLGAFAVGHARVSQSKGKQYYGQFAGAREIGDSEWVTVQS